MTNRRAERGGARAALVAGWLVAALALALTGCGDADPDRMPSSASQPASTAAEPPGSASPPSSTGASITDDRLPAPTSAADITSAESATAARALLGSLSVQGRSPQTGYSRAQFGQTWSDDVTADGGHNGCDTRNDVLRRDITDALIKPGTQGCVVLSGTLADPYTGTVVPFLRGAATSDDVQIDHVVALSDAWQTGAQQLSAEQRLNLANDPDNLQSTQGWLNQQKGSGDAATWLPPNKQYRCTYVTRQIEVKAKYRLWVKPAEKAAMAGVLDGCTGAPAAGTDQQSSRPAAPDSQPTGPDSQPTEGPQPTAAGSPGAVAGSAPFRNCAAARAAGAAPVHAGDPGYSTDLDGDRDGIACE